MKVKLVTEASRLQVHIEAESKAESRFLHALNTKTAGTVLTQSINDTYLSLQNSEARLVFTIDDSPTPGKEGEFV